jgi:nucleoside-diphosphate-sugar epimerase
MALLSSFSQYSGKTVLVTGATGFTGKVLTRKLVEAGAVVRAIARTSSDLGGLTELDVEWYRGDVFDSELVAEAAKNVSYIFHLAAAFREVKSDDNAYRLVHLESTKWLAEAALKTSGFKRFVHISTVGVHGHIETGSADENYWFAPGDGYQRTKLEGELWLAKFASEHGLPHSIIRPGAIYGPGDTRLLKIYRMVSKGYMPILGQGKCMYHLVHVDDLTNVILLAGITDEALSEVMIAVCDEPISIEDMSRTIARNMNKSVRIVRLPLWPFYLASDVCELVCTPLGIQPPIFRRRVDFYTKDRVFDNTKIKRVLNYEFNFNNDRGIEQTTQWYLENGLLN